MTQTASRSVSRSRYESLLETYGTTYNIKPSLLAVSSARKYAYIRFKIFRELRDLGFSYPAIGNVAGFHHTSILHGVRIARGEPTKKRPPVKASSREFISHTNFAHRATDIAKSPMPFSVPGIAIHHGSAIAVE